jgi:general secretion pathway protein A
MKPVEDNRKESLADDPGFLASLTDLDRGMARQADPAAAPPKAAPPDAAAARAPRPLLELFPPSGTEPDAPFAAFPVPAAPLPAARRSSAPSASSARLRSPASSASSASSPGPPTTCETFYGLSEPPFSLSSTDLKFLYQSTAYDAAAQTMLGAIARRDGIVVLTGAMGIGKTMLCRAVIDQLDRRTLISFVDQPFRSADDLLRKVLIDFGVISRAEASSGRLTKAPRTELSTALRDFLNSLAPLQAFAVVIIDEAQNLPSEVLEQVRVLVDAEGDERLLQVVLVGQPALQGTLGRRELRPLWQRIAVRCVLGPLAADEIEGYITHRLRAAGARPRVEFDLAAIDRIYELSRGNPRVVNLLCERALSAGHGLSASTIDRPIVDAAAEELELAPPLTRASVLRLVGVVVILLLLAVVGAASAALIFRDDVTAVMKRWQHQAVPAAPASNRPAL